MDHYRQQAEKLLDFIQKSPCAFWAVDTLREIAEQAGFVELKENKEWQLKCGGKYYVIRNDSSIIAFQMPKHIKGFHIVASHSDSPSFKIKENPEIAVENQYVKLNTEKYGGMIMSTWLDRPLSVAGRVVYRKDDCIVGKLVKIDRDLLVIPNVAIHMDRNINQGMEYNAQTDMLPLFAQYADKKSFNKLLAEEMGIAQEDILSHDLYLYVRQKGSIFGANDEFILSPRLDDLQCAYSAMTALIQSTSDNYVNICAVFDNEEVGSSTRQGADSTFLTDVLYRIAEAVSEKESWLVQAIGESFLISADNAHALHPNHPEKADPTNRPVLNGGIVIKYHGGQKYTTDAYSAARIKELCQKSGVPFQTYANRSDIAGGSTLGNISMAHVSVPSVDIGLPQLAMHSAVETAGIKDTEYAIRLFEGFYGE